MNANKCATQTVIINSSNYIGNATFRYQFPSAVTFHGCESVGVQSLAIFNSTFNITSALNNNQFTLSWMTGVSTSTSQTYTIPDSYLAISDINAFIQTKMYANNLYISGTNNTVNYYFTITSNGSRYASQLNFYPLPTTAQMTSNSYTAPSGCPFPIQSSATPCPITITFGSGFGSLLGFNGGTYGSFTNTTLQNILSPMYPSLNPINNYIFGCSLINNPYQIPTNIMYSLPLTQTLGGLIASSIGSIVYLRIVPGTYMFFDIILYDNNFNLLKLNDPEMVLQLSICVPKGDM